MGKFKELHAKLREAGKIPELTDIDHTNAREVIDTALQHLNLEQLEELRDNIDNVINDLRFEYSDLD